MPYFYTTSEDYFPRNKFIIFAALPSIVLTLLGILLIFFIPQLTPLFFFPLMVNLLGGIGDALVDKQCLRYAKHVYVLDKKHSNEVFGYSEDALVPKHKKQTVLSDPSKEPSKV